VPAVNNVNGKSISGGASSHVTPIYHLPFARQDVSRTETKDNWRISLLRSDLRLDLNPGRKWSLAKEYTETEGNAILYDEMIVDELTAAERHILCRTLPRVEVQRRTKYRISVA
jgi:hypothetical protein